MKSLFHTAAELETFLVERGWRYCFIGGIALQRWGQPRLTNDVDLTILAGFGNEAAYVDVLLERYHARIPEGREFALTHRVLLLQSHDGIPIDVALGGIPFEEQVVLRATRHEFLPGLSLLICSAEDLIVLKAFANRPRDWGDVETIITRQRGHLDWSYVFEQLEPLCQVKEAPEIVDRLHRLAGTDVGQEPGQGSE
ncbi:MAG: nucleotidyl transferase AbiEii/AbiGii toxin family protein [Phycisphaerae bacterium]|nr:nucleotidyl transferase AbiEii/AbiGii toxin family protein [Phycisphaerae bacterium]